MARKTVPPDIKKDVLVSSRRRCTVCFGLLGNSSVKKGQIAHLDRDNTNDKFENLVFLCLKHHDEYDSTTSQSKGWTEAEVKKYRDDLYVYIKERLPFSWVNYPSSQGGPKIHKRLPLSLEVYDRRIQIYRIVKDFLVEILARATISEEHLQKFAKGTDEVIFLFDKDLAEYLLELYQKARSLRYKNEKLMDKYGWLPVGEERSKLAEKYAEELGWFESQIGIMREKFSKYIALG